ncbi:MAG: hypothetical protein QOG12_424 [Verrucomicrobiota bacterium]|jgi:hypothetical protein
MRPGDCAGRRKSLHDKRTATTIDAGTKMMKRTVAWLIAMMICASVARGGEVKITVVTSAGGNGKPTTVFASDTPEIRATFKTTETKKGDKLRGEWIADEVGEVAPPHTKIGEKVLALEQDDGGGYFTFSKPTKGWPPGKYHLDIYAGDKLTATVKFTVEGAKPADTADADDAQYTFKVKNENVQRITKLLASEDGKKYLDFDIGKGIDVGETKTIAWDKSTNKMGCDWYIKAVYADKSVGEAVKFDFCEKDVLISF